MYISSNIKRSMGTPSYICMTEETNKKSTNIFKVTIDLETINK